MSTNIGLGSSNIFTKPKAFVYDVGPVQNLKVEENANIDPEKIRLEVLKTIGSLNPDQSQVDLDKDENPLDNIIIDQVVKIMSLRKIARTKIQMAIQLISQGQDPFTVFSQEENILLLTQTRQLEKISETEYFALSSSPVNLWFNHRELYMDMLQFQLSLPETVPTIDELKLAGMVDFIIKTVKENPEAVIDVNLIQKFTKEYIDTVLLSSEFIGYDNAQKIYKDPAQILRILNKTQMNNFLYRVKPYLQFITDDKIKTIFEWLPSQYGNINTLFSDTQIRLMVDKELDIKNLIMKTLTLEGVQQTFNDLAIEFKKDFTETFTNEKLMELIQLTIDRMFPVLDTTQIYEQICSQFNIDYNQVDIDSIESYIDNYFN